MNTPATDRVLRSRVYWTAHSLLLLLLALAIGWDIAFDAAEPERADARLLLAQTDMAAGMLESGVSSVEALFAAVDAAVAKVPPERLDVYLTLLVRSRRDVASISVSDDHGQTVGAAAEHTAVATTFTRARDARLPYSISIALAPEFWARLLAPVSTTEKDTDVAVVTADGRSVLPFSRYAATDPARLAAGQDLQADAALVLTVPMDDGAHRLALRRVAAPFLEGGGLVVGLMSGRVVVRTSPHAIPLTQALAWLAAALISSLVLARELRARRRVEESAVKMRCDSAVRENFINVVLEHAPIMVSYWDAERRCRYANGMYTDWFNRAEGPMVGKGARTILGEALYAVCEPLIDATLRGEAQTFEQHRARTDGSTGYVLSRYIPDMVDGKVQGFFVIASDVTELKETQLQLQKRVDDLYAMATTDSLTGLGNRRNLLEKIQFEIELSRRLDLQVSFLMLDIDHFKRINDTFGHDAGDAVLRRLGLLLRETLRTADHAGRLGGEEFGVLLTGTSPEEAYAVAERLRKKVMDLVVEHGGEAMRLTISIGVAWLVADTDRPLEAMMKKADTALYQAKNNGRNLVCVAGNRGSSVAGGRCAGWEDN